MTQACSQAGVTPSEIHYINAHGTGTPLNDAAETHAIHNWAGDAVRKIPVSSTKAGIGHLLGAAGAVEAVACLMALRGQWLPPEPADLQVDPLCRFPVVTQPTQARLEQVMSNSFGFGGANATLVFRRFP
jgi:3-oxoacyl-[acyl-carrier-protein] synthase II